jgi:hypothetical protein
MKNVFDMKILGRKLNNITGYLSRETSCFSKKLVILKNNVPE